MEADKDVQHNIEIPPSLKDDIKPETKILNWVAKPEKVCGNASFEKSFRDALLLLFLNLNEKFNVFKT